MAAGQITPREGALDINMEEPKNETRIKADLGCRVLHEKIVRISLTGFVTQQKDAIVLSGQTEEYQECVMELYLNRDQDQIGVELDIQGAPILQVIEPFVNITAMKSRADSDGEMVKDEEYSTVVGYPDYGRRHMVGLRQTFN